MERKAKVGKGALLIIGAVYALLGGIFVILGAALMISLQDSPSFMAGSIFACIGSLFLILGIIFLCIVLHKKKRANKLIQQGRYIWGEIMDCIPNFNVRINGRHPYIATVRYQDARGTVHIFKSESMNIYRDPSIIGKQVKVYIEDDSFKHYYVDLEGILPQFVEH